MKTLILSLTLSLFVGNALAFDKASLDAANQKIMGNTNFDIDKSLYNQSIAVEQGPGIAYLRPVLYGILYRGGSGVRAPMNEKQLQLQCNAGFGAVDYGYAGASGATVSCDGGNHFAYKSLSADPRRLAPFFQDVLNAIQGKTGPVLAHCWFGQHESGELATYALMQFCGINVATATHYWETHANGSNSPQFNPVRTNIASFGTDAVKSLYTQFAISPADAALICPKFAQ